MPELRRAVREVHLAIEPRLMELIEAPWCIMYACERKHVIIVAIIDGRRDVGAVLEGRFGLKLSDSQ